MDRGEGKVKWRRLRLGIIHASSFPCYQEHLEVSLEVKDVKNCLWMTRKGLSFNYLGGTKHSFWTSGCYRRRQKASPKFVGLQGKRCRVSIPKSVFVQPRSILPGRVGPCQISMRLWLTYLVKLKQLHKTLAHSKSGQKFHVRSSTGCLLSPFRT